MASKTRVRSASESNVSLEIFTGTSYHLSGIHKDGPTTHNYLDTLKISSRIHGFVCLIRVLGNKDDGVERLKTCPRFLS